MSTLAKKFGKNLKTLREKAKLDGHKLSIKVGVAASHLSMLERGERSPSLAMVERVAKFFKVDPVSMLRGTDA